MLLRKLHLPGSHEHMNEAGVCGCVAAFSRKWKQKEPGGSPCSPGYSLRCSDPSGYGSWRKFCGLSVPNTTVELAEVLRNVTLAQKLQLLYRTPHNIDLWVGAISEPALPGGRVGPLLSCLLARQFRALRDGDR